MNTTSIEAYIAQSESIIDAYEWANDDLMEIKNNLQRIRDKVNDENLNLGVIGEYSSGKSTLINSLVRRDLLKSEADQGTTAAATIIRYGIKFNIFVTDTGNNTLDYLKNRKKLIQFCNIAGELMGNPVQKISWFMDRVFRPRTFAERRSGEIYKLIDALSATEEISERVKDVTIFYPCEQLKQNLVVIDTPGLDSQNNRHDTVTAAAIRDLCDAAVIIIPADKPLSMTLKAFLHKHLEDVLHRCIFVITKIELVARRRDHEKLIVNIKSRIEEEWGITNPTVIPMPTLLAFENYAPDAPDSGLFTDFESEKKEYYLAMYQQSEETIYSIVRTQKDIIRLEVALILFNQLFVKITEKLEAMKDVFEQQHKALIENPTIDLEQYTRQSKEVYGKKLQEKIDAIRAEIKATIEKNKTNISNVIWAKIQGMAKKRALRDYVTKEIPKYLKSSLENLPETINVKAQSVNYAATNVLSEYECDFRKQYKKLATLNGLMKQNDANNLASNETINSAAKNSRTTLCQMDVKDQNNLALARLGTTAIAATVGTILLPGIGTLIGMTVGALVSLLFGKSLDEMKSDYWDEVDHEIDKLFESVQNDVDKQMDRISSETQHNLYARINEYMVTYRALVQTMIENDKMKQLDLEKKEHAINDDLSAIQNSIEAISQKRLELKSVRSYENQVSADSNARGVEKQ